MDGPPEVFEGGRGRPAPGPHFLGSWVYLLIFVVEENLAVIGCYAVEARIRIGWNKFRQLVPLLPIRTYHWQ